MPDYLAIEQLLSRSLHLSRRPVAVAFPDSAPAGIARLSGTQPSGCSFWRLAAEGRAFYTVPSDHYNCPIGSYTHRLPLPEERAAELSRTLSFFAGIGYLAQEDLAAISRLPLAPAVVVYAPLGDSPLDPDVVLLAGLPGRLMLLQEAALRAGVAAGRPLLGRPTCAMLPVALAGDFVFSSGCVGNRIYAEVGEDELYAAFAGRDLEKIAAEFDTIVEANAALAEFHRARRRELASE